MIGARAACPLVFGVGCGRCAQHGRGRVNCKQAGGRRCAAKRWSLVMGQFPGTIMAKLCLTVRDEISHQQRRRWRRRQETYCCPFSVFISRGLMLARPFMLATGRFPVAASRIWNRLPLYTSHMHRLYTDFLKDAEAVFVRPYWLFVSCSCDCLLGLATFRLNVSLNWAVRRDSHPRHSFVFVWTRRPYTPTLSFSENTVLHWSTAT